MRTICPSTTITFSIFQESWTGPDKEHGEPGFKDEVFDRETSELDEFLREIDICSFDQASSSQADARTWFTNSTAPMTAARIEKGVEDFYSLHIHEVDGHVADVDDILTIGELIGVKFSDSELERRRREAADAAFEDADFGDLSVEAHNGWETEGDHYRKDVFLDVGAEDTEKMTFAIDFRRGTAVLVDEPEFDLPEYKGDDAKIYGYYVNLDERGEFYADVRDEDGSTVFKIRVDGDADGSIFEDGFMSSKDDTAGLQAYLRELRVIDAAGVIHDMATFEAKLEARNSPSPEM